MNKPPIVIGRISESRKSRTTSDALEILDAVIGQDAPLRELVEQATINAMVAKLIQDSRSKAGLTQKQLADLIGTRQPVIARLEDADYRGHSLTMLQRIAKALNQRLDIRLSPMKRTLRRAS